MKTFSTFIILTAVIAVCFVLALSDSYYMDIFVLTCFYATLAVAWNLMAGLTGLMSLGHALFVGIGAYSVAWGFSVHGWPPYITWPMGVAISVVAAAIIGALCFRYGLKGYFFAIATLAFNEVAFFIVSATTELGRSDGLILPMADDPVLHLQFYDKWPYGLIVGGILLATLLGGTVLMQTRVGYYWRALRDNEDAAQALGVDVRKMKMLSFMISAGISGLCGSFYASYISFVDPRSVLGVDLSIQMLVYSIIGGMSVLWGPLVGAGLLVPLSVLLRNFTAIKSSDIIFYALVLIVLALILPQGLAGWFMARINERRPRPAPGSVQPVKVQ